VAPHAATGGSTTGLSATGGPGFLAGDQHKRYFVFEALANPKSTQFFSNSVERVYYVWAPRQRMIERLGLQQENDFCGDPEIGIGWGL